MTRISLPSSSSMNEQQRRIYDEIAGGERGYVPAPLLALLRSPELAHRAEQLGAFVRYQTSLPPRLSELAILVTARYWSAHYAWSIHKKEAQKAGLALTIIDAIAMQQHPHFEHPDEQAVYDFSVALQTNHQVSDEQYRAAVEKLGEQGVVELVGVLGYYTLMAMTLNVFEIEVPEGEQAELTPYSHSLILSHKFRDMSDS